MRVSDQWQGISIQEYNPPVAASPSTEIAMLRKTLADTLAARETIYVNCAHPMCCKSTKLDIQALIDRLGRDHGSMHDDLSDSLSAQIARLPVETAGRCSWGRFR